jgi:hypothetical protein
MKPPKPPSTPGPPDRLKPNGVALALDVPDELVELIARRVADLLPARDTTLERLLTVDALADLLGTSPDWVRRHQAELGGYRLSDGGGRNPVRFRMSVVEKFLADRQLVAPARASGRADPDWALG